MPLTDQEFDEAWDGYIACAFWASTTDGDEPEPLDDIAGPEDLAAEQEKVLKGELKDFLEDNEFNLRITPGEWSWSQHGHDFWLTRNGHGAGFWDRGYGDIGTKLTDACEPYGSCNLYVGDDGKVYTHG
jgi:hypothetical protein